MNKKIGWKKSKRMTCAKHIAARIEANKVRAQLSVLTPDREKEARQGLPSGTILTP